MFYRITVLLMCLCSLPLVAGEKMVKILIGKNLDGAMIEVTGSYNVYDPNGNHRIGTAFGGKARFLQPVATGIRWGEEFPGVYQVRITPDNPKTAILVNGIQYLGSITAYEVNHKLQLVNTVPVEEYLHSIMSAKFDEAISPEVLNAVAIVERTQVYYQISQGANQYWDVDAEKVAYHGHAVFSLFDGPHSAVESTRGLVMVNPAVEAEDKVFHASWTRNSAGRTISLQTMRGLDGAAPQKGVEAPFAARDQHQTTWSTEASLGELAQIARVPRVTNFKLFTDEASGKVYKVRLEGADTARDLDFYTFQSALGKDRLRSSTFTASRQGENIVLKGAGEGDGVGLCLYEAQKMAERGDKASTILGYFFPGTAVELVRPEPDPANKLAEAKRLQHERGLKRMRHGGGA